jgi:hypothetical protein
MPTLDPAIGFEDIDDVPEALPSAVEADYYELILLRITAREMDAHASIDNTAHARDD